MTRMHIVEFAIGLSDGTWFPEVVKVEDKDGTYSVSEVKEMADGIVNTRLKNFGSVSFFSLIGYSYGAYELDA